MEEEGGGGVSWEGGKKEQETRGASLEIGNRA